MNRLIRLEHSYLQARNALKELTAMGTDTRRLADHVHWLRRQYIRELRDSRQLAVKEHVTTAEQQAFLEDWIRAGGEI
jgi:hypothetical protein